MSKSYDKMTVKQLKELCDEQGIEYQSGVLKAELVRLLERYGEPIEVEAEMLDGEIIPTNALVIDYDAIKETAVELTKAMDDASTVLGELSATPEMLEEMSLTKMRENRDGLKAARKEVNELRLELGRKFTAPKKAVDEECNKLIGVIDEEIAKYQEPIKEAVLRGYREQYINCCESVGLETLPQVLTFESFMALHPKWSYKNANALKVQEAIAAEVKRVADDWAVLRTMKSSMRFYDDAEIEFFKTLDIQSAITLNDTRTASQQQIEAINQEREANESWVRQQTQTSSDQMQKPLAKFSDIRKLYQFTAYFNDAELESLREWKNATKCGVDWKFGRVEGIQGVA